MLIPFIKMQAQGNDFVIWIKPEMDTWLDLGSLAIRICDRRFGVGGDGLVILIPEMGSHPRMLIHNADGSQAMMCGSALRCCAAILSELTGRKQFEINTDSGEKQCRIITPGKHPVVESMIAKPVIRKQNIVIQGVSGSLIDAGNLHFIIETDDLEDQNLAHRAASLQKDPSLGTGVNVHHVRYVNDRMIDMVIWEHGVGATLACGTGAVSAVFLGIMSGYLKHETKVNMPGGSVMVRLDKESGMMWMSGNVKRVFSGEYEWNNSDRI